MLAGKAGLSSPVGCDGRRLLGHQLKGAGASHLARRVSRVSVRHIARKCSPEGVAGPAGKGDGTGGTPRHSNTTLNSRTYHKFSEIHHKSLLLNTSC